MNILLIHGLSRTSLSLLGLQWSLQQAGYITEQFSYFAFSETFDQIVERLRLTLQLIANQGNYAIVTHSLGGILTRAALGNSNLPLPQQTIMLGPPNQPPRLATLAWKFPMFQWFTGECGFNLSNKAFFDSLPGLESPYTIIAGTAGPRGVWSPFGDEINDGIVALSETRLSPDDEIIELPVAHTFMMNDYYVQENVLKALKS